MLQTSYLNCWHINIIVFFFSICSCLLVCFLYSSNMYQSAIEKNKSGPIQAGQFGVCSFSSIFPPIQWLLFVSSSCKQAAVFRFGPRFVFPYLFLPLIGIKCCCQIMARRVSEKNPSDRSLTAACGFRKSIWQRDAQGVSLLAVPLTSHIQEALQAVYPKQNKG